MRPSLLGSALAGLGLLCLSACDARPRTAQVEVRFEPSDLRSGLAVMELSFVEGGCSGERAIYAAEIPAGAARAMSAPPVLDPGTYGIRAEARNASCRVYAAGCTEATLPRDDGATVTVTVTATAERNDCAPADTCEEGVCRPPVPVTTDGGCTAANETCNGADDDCDGTVDEGFDLASDPLSCGSCGHACRDGVACSDGVCEDEAIVQIVSGEAHTCALRTDGAVLCWGDNDEAQVGDDSRWTRRARPVRVVRIDDAVSIAAGRRHTCAVHAGGTVSCWGANGGGQLGDGTTTVRDHPVDVPGLSGVERVTGGDDHTCALTSDGAVWCWGSNGSGELGDGTTTQRLAPVAVAGLSGEVASLVAGDSFTCALLASGGVSCWGRNDEGQLGDGTTTQRPAPGAVAAIADAVALSALDDSACAALASGEVRCWGSNDDGQLGDGTTADRNAPVAVLGVSGADAVAIGGRHGCAGLAGAVACWGANEVGQLGEGTTTDRPTAVTVPDLDQVTALAAGASHSCALRGGGQVLCWGDRTGYQIGDGDILVSEVPMDVTGLAAGVTQIDPGSDHTCAVLDTGGIACWGANYRGQLGTGSTSEPALAPVMVPAIADAVKVSAGDELTCALRAGGVVACWGRNDAGQLGDGGTSDRPVPAAVTGIGAAVDVAAQYGHTCAALADGTVSCWGNNETGQLGDGTTTSSSIPIAVAGITGAVAVTVGVGHSCALGSAGEVWCWGWGGRGEVGDGSTVDTIRPAPVRVTAIPAADALAAAGYHTCARTGTDVWCWGYNESGRLGAGTNGWDWGAREHVLDLGDAVALDAGGASACALRSTGAVACWGGNANGQLGDGSRADRTAPVAVTGIADAVAIGVGDGHTCAVRADGSAACWGNDRTGELGDAPVLFATTPTAIVPP